MGAKQSKSGKLSQQNGQNGGAAGDDLDTFNKTSTLPASFRDSTKADDDVTKTGTLPREGAAEHEQNTSFSKRFRRSVSKLIGKDEKGEKSPKKDINQEAGCCANGDASSPVKKSQDEGDAVKSPVDHKLAQKIARAKFFQDLYTTPTNVPKPPRSHNISFDKESGDETVDGKLTPVVKLIEKHQEAIEKHQEEIRNSMSSPDVMKTRMESFRKSKLIESNEKAEVKQEVCITTESSQQQSSSVQKTEHSVEQTESCSSKIEERKESVSMSQSSSVQSATVVEKSETISEQSSVQKTESSIQQTESSVQKIESSEFKSQEVAESMQVTSSESVSVSSEEKSMKCEEVSMVAEMSSTTSESSSMRVESSSATAVESTMENISQSSVQQSETLSTQEFSAVQTSEIKTSQESEESETVNNEEALMEKEESNQVERNDDQESEEDAGAKSDAESEPED